MGEETTTSSSTSETQGGLDPTTETVTKQNGATPGSTTTESNNDLQERFARMEAALKKANSEAKSYRLEADELKKFREQIEAEKLSDTEKQTLAQKKLEQQLAEHQAQNSELLTRLQRARIDNEVFRHAITQGLDAKAAAKLMDHSEVLTDDSGTPTNVPELLKKLQKEYPTLLVGRQVPSAGGSTNPSRSQTSGPQTITKEYVQEVQRGGKATWDALSEEERLRVRRFISEGGLRKR